MRPRRTPSHARSAHRGRVLHRLTQDQVAQLLRSHTPGRHADGGNLYLRIRPNAAPTWVFLYQLTGAASPREMRLGDARGMTLARARELARAARDQLAGGGDPLGLREDAHAASEAKRQAAEREAARGEATLEREARRLHKLLEPTFRNTKHAAQWLASLEAHVPEKIWRAPIADVTPGQLLDFLQPLYAKLPETGRRVRMRLDNIFDDAMLRGLTAGNPAAAVKKTLTKLGARKAKGSFAALAWAKVPALVKRLRPMEGTAPRALEFALLTAARTGEVLGMEWSEVDEPARLWVVPAGRMKGGEPHVVYLSDRALAILEQVRGLDKRFVFPSLMRPGQGLSNMALLMTLRRLAAAEETTVHGLCRASFSTWANERGAYRPDVIEACLAHRERDLVRAAYNKAEFAGERRKLLADWARFVGGEKARVVSLKDARAARSR